MASFTAAGTAYATWGQPMIPFFIFYSMFGFQRVGDLIWSFGDQRGTRVPARRHRRAAPRSPARGCSTATARASCCATACPNCRAYDPAFAYEVAVIIRDGIERMYGDEPEDCFYYLTLYNENYVMPAMPEGVEDGIVRGLYRYRERRTASAPHRAQILASGTAMLGRARGAADARRASTTSRADVWSATRYKLLREDALSTRAVEPAAPHRAPRARRTSPSCSATPRARSSRSPTT